MAAEGDFIFRCFLAADLHSAGRLLPVTDDGALAPRLGKGLLSPQTRCPLIGTVAKFVGATVSDPIGPERENTAVLLGVARGSWVIGIPASATHVRLGDSS